MADERDPDVSRRYRALGGEEPSRELDQAILAAAHRAADKAHAPLVAPAGRHRWYFAFGAAAILVLAVAVTVQVERQQPDPEMAPVTPVASAPKEGYSSKEEKEGPPAAAEQRRDAEPRKRVEAAKARPGPLPDAAPPARSQAEAVQDAVAGEANRVESQPKAAAPPASARLERPEQQGGLASSDVRRAAPQAAAAPEATVSAIRLSPEHLLERIAGLRKEGRHEEADKALAEFRQRYPDYRLSEEMLQKVERKK